MWASRAALLKLNAAEQPSWSEAEGWVRPAPGLHNQALSEAWELLLRSASDKDWLCTVLWLEPGALLLWLKVRAVSEWRLVSGGRAWLRAFLETAGCSAGGIPVSLARVTPARACRAYCRCSHGAADGARRVRSGLGMAGMVFDVGWP